MEKNNKKSKKKLRGMTLVEVIIAIAIFAMLGAVLILVGTSIDQYSRSTKHMNDKIAVQGPIAETQDTDGSVLINDNLEIKVNGSITVRGNLYDTAQYAIDDSGNYSEVPDENGRTGKNLKYITGIQFPTAAATTAAPTT